MPRAPFRALAALGFALSMQVSPASGGLLLNEVLYDPDGPDDGFEFVELWNPDSTGFPLEGISVEAGDGSRPGSWTVIYTGAPGDSVPPRSPFLIAGSALHGAMQNGPDAVRLTRDGVVLDVLGYGALADPELSEGSPAPDAPSGQSLARMRDGVDTGSNAAGWAADPEPTPGRANHPDVRLAIGRASLDPEVPWPGEAFTLSADVKNRGRLPVEESRYRLDAFLGSDPAASVPVESLAPGESARVMCSLPAPAAGSFELLLVLRDLRGEPNDAIADTLRVEARAGAGPLLVNEIAFHDRGVGEWVEIAARESIPDLGAWSLSDGTDHRDSIDRGASPRPLRAGDLLVLAESPAAVRSFYSLPESLVLGCRGGWPALNDTDGRDGFADRVRVLDPAGIASDAVPYRAEYAARDASLERLAAGLPSGSAGTWAECVDPRAGTPGRPNSMRAPDEAGIPAGRLLVASSPVLRRAPGAPVTAVVLSFGPAARGARVRVLVHDLLGRTRRHLIDGIRVLGEAAFLWDGTDDAGVPVAAGAYVARAETLPDAGEPARSGALALTVLDR